MPVAVQDLFVKIRDKWLSIEPKNKVRIIILAVVLVVALVATIFVLTKKNYVGISETSLSQTQMSNVTTILNKEGIVTKPNKSLDNILIDEKDFPRAKMVYFSSPEAKSEFDFSDAVAMIGLSTTSEDKKVIYMHALEADVQTQITQTQTGIEDVVVKYALPPSETSILPNQAPATASVIITFKPSVLNQTERGAAIAKFVASAAIGLKVENVTVVDANSRQIYPPKDSDSMDSLSQASDRIANDAKAKILELYTGVYDDVRATAYLEVRYDSETGEINEFYSPEGAPKGQGIPVYTVEKVSEAKNTTVDGEPGEGTNDGATEQAATYPVEDGAVGTYATQDASENKYGLNEKNIKYEKRPGVIDFDKSSMAVVLTNSRTYDQLDVESSEGLGGLTWKRYQDELKGQRGTPVDISADVYETLRNMFSSATGINKNNIFISQYQIPLFVDKIAPKVPIGSYALIGLLIALIALLAIGLIKRTEPEEIIDFEPELAVEELIVSTKQEPESASVAEIDYGIDSELKKQIDKFVDDKPEAVAQLLRNWLSDEWD